MKNKAYYHIFMPDDLSWSYIVIDQIKDLIESGVAEKLEVLNVTSIGNQESTEHLIGLLQYYNQITGLNIFLNPIRKDYDDSSLLNIDRNINILTETTTLNKLWQDAKESVEEYNILYFHTKGVTAVERVLKQRNYRTFVNYLHWRKHCEWSIFEKHQEALVLLGSEFDAVGTNYTDWPTKHFSGNVWWAQSKYISSLEDPASREWWEKYKTKNPQAFSWLPDRLSNEMWIGSGEDAKLYSFYNHPSPPPISNLGEQIILRKDYYK